jgi:ketosteroid isomerase-like protein
MTTRSTTDETDIRRHIDRLVEAIRGMDLEGLKRIYAPDVVSFDVEPPLQHVGAEAKLKNWMGVFAAYQRPLDYEVRDLMITMGDGVAFAHSLNRLSGTLRNGTKGGIWVRFTACFRKIDDVWLIAHDQVSVPIDFANGNALLDLEP